MMKINILGCMTYLTKSFIYYFPFLNKKKVFTIQNMSIFDLL